MEVATIHLRTARRFGDVAVATVQQRRQKRPLKAIDRLCLGIPERHSLVDQLFDALVESESGLLVHGPVDGERERVAGGRCVDEFDKQTLNAVPEFTDVAGPGVRLKFAQVLFQKPVYFILNKAEEPFEREAVPGLFRGQGMNIREEDVRPVFYASSGDMQNIKAQPSFRAFAGDLKARFSRDRVSGIKQDHLSKLRIDLTGRLDRLVDLLERENRASEAWSAGLESLYEEVVYRDF